MEKNSDKKNMTGLISLFSRVYNTIENSPIIFNESIGKDLFRNGEYEEISNKMSLGISFFNPSFKGTRLEALNWIVNNYLSPSPLGRSIFCEDALKTAVKIGAVQYIILGSGYDTFAYRRPNWALDISVFELDQGEVIKDKISRLEEANIKIPENTFYIECDFALDNWISKLKENPSFDINKKTFVSLLGVIYYLPSNVFTKLISDISSILSEGSSIVFDYPDEYTFTDKAGERTKKQLLLAKGANETMLSGYSYEEIEKILSDSGMLIFEHLNPDEITENIFGEYNSINQERPILGFDNVNYVLAVKKG